MFARISAKSYPAEILKSFEELNKKVSGKRSEKLSGREITDLVAAGMTPEIIAVLHEGLQRKAIDPDSLLVHLVRKTSSNKYLVPFSFCLREGASVNTYVNTPDLGTVHILVYLYHSLYSEGDENIDLGVLEAMVLLLILKGSLTSLPAFDSDAGKIKSEIDSNPGQSVRDWLQDRNYSSVVFQINTGSPKELQNLLTDESIRSLAMMLDNPTLFPVTYRDSDVENMIELFSTNCLNYFFRKNSSPNIDLCLSMSVYYLDDTAFNLFLQQGYTPSYELINLIIFEARNYKELKRTIPFAIFESMIFAAIDAGIEFDNEQMSVLYTLGANTESTANKKYSVPYWKKTCTVSNGTVSDSLRRTAASLNIDSSGGKKGICRSIEEIYRGNSSEMTKTGRKRQGERLRVNLGKMTNFVGDKSQELVCRNKGSLLNDPLDYSDINISYYRDEGDVVWCFPSTMFSTLLTTRKNPYTEQDLPDSFLDVVEKQFSLLQGLGVYSDSGLSSDDPLTFPDAFERLKTPDRANDRKSSKELEKFFALGFRNNRDRDFLINLDPAVFETAFSSIGLEMNLSGMSRSHALATTASVVNRLGAQDQIDFFYGVGMDEY